MEKKDALSYIAKFIENSSIRSNESTKYELRLFFAKELGDSLFDSSDKKLIALAKKLYISYVLSKYTRYTAFSIIKSKMTEDEMKSFLESQVKLDKKYNVYYDTINRDLSDKSIISHIKKQGLTNYKSIINKMIPENSPTAIKYAESKRRAEEKEAKKKASSKTDKKASSKTDKKASSKTDKKASSKTDKKVSSKTDKKVSSKTDKKASSKKCDDYTVVELKKLAKDKGKTGYSAMKKADLCKLLSLK